MTVYETKVASPWNAERAFAYMADLSNYDDWDPGTKHAVKVTGGSVRVGSRFDLTVGRTTLRYEVIELAANRRIRATARTRVLRSLDTITIEDRADGCSVTYHAKLTLKGPLRIFDPVLAVLFHRMGEKAADGLAERLDGRRLD